MVSPTVSFDQSMLGAVVLLSGGPVATPLVAGTGCSVLDMPVRRDRTVLGQWLDHLGEAGVLAGGVAVRVVHSARIPTPTIPERYAERVERLAETDSYRGPAGAVRDAIRGMDPGRSVLIIEAARYHAAGVGAVLERASVDQADLLVTCNADHSPAGVYVMRGAAFDHVPETGYMDLKEQLIERLGSVGDVVRVVEHDTVVSVPIRTRREMLAAASMAANGIEEVSGVRTASGSVLSLERWSSVVARGAEVSERAAVHESVIMEGAGIPAGAVVARSVIGRGARLSEGDVVVDRVIRAGTTGGGAVSSRRRGVGLRRLLERSLADRIRAART